MKKFLVLSLSAAMVLSLAAAAMAEVKVAGDFRYELISDSAKTGQDALYDNPDLRVQVDGKVSDSLSAWLQMRCQPAQGDATKSPDKGNFYIDEYYFTMNTGFATFKVGDFDYKVNPSRVLVKSNDYNIMTRANTLVTANIPLGDKLYVGAAYAIDGRKTSSLEATQKTVDGEIKYPVSSETSKYEIQDGAYDVSIGFKTDKFGAEIHTFDTKAEANEDTKGYDVVKTSLSFDAWYKLSDNIKLFAFGNDPKYTANKDTGVANDPDMNPIAGVTFDKIAGKNFKATLEYGLGKNNTNTACEFTPYGVQLVYGFSNGLGLEFEHNNYAAKTTEETKSVVRFRAKF